VVGLFDNMTYEEASVEMHPGEIFLAYSDGVTEPENDFGEFGEERLIDLVRTSRNLPLAQISQEVTLAVDNWIGDNEQPDDVTLVLARAKKAAQIFFSFHFPCLNRRALAAAMALSAIAMEKKAPLERICNGIASQ